MSEGEKLEKDLESLGLDALSLKNVTAASEKKSPSTQFRDSSWPLRTKMLFWL